MGQRSARVAVATAVAGLLSGALAVAPARAATIILTVPNAIEVTTIHSWCGGTITQVRQINGAFQSGTPTVYIHRARSTLWCLLPVGHLVHHSRHGGGDGPHEGNKE